MNPRNVINFPKMNHPKDVSYFIKSILEGQRRGYQDFIISLRQVDSIYPNAIVPVAGIISYLRHRNVAVDVIDIPEYLLQASFSMPLLVAQYQALLSNSPLDKVWNFHDSVDIKTLVDAFVHEVTQVAICEEGVLEGLTWCLNEVMDNVLQHSGGNEGYIMGQIHRSKGHLAICIFDPGQGIYSSLKDTKYAPRYPIDAITLAIKEGVTRDKRIGQGNGMWGLHNIVKANSGSLAITSNGACYSLKGDDIRTYKSLPYLSREFGFTTIDFQIDFGKKISITNALGGHQPINIRIEAMENEQGNIVYKLAEKSSGTGTRQSGERIRNELINLYNESGRIIEIDFAEVAVISSSFADELVGKLVAMFGFARFTQIYRLKNMNDIVLPIVDRSVSQRIATLFQSAE